MNRILTAIILTAALVLLAPVQSQAQTLDTVKITVRDSDSNLLEGVSVDLVDDFSSVFFSTSDANGEAIFTEVTSGIYDVEVRPSFSGGCDGCAILLDEITAEQTIGITSPGYDAGTNSIDLGVMTLETGDRIVTVTVVDDVQTPVADVLVNAFSTEDFEAFRSGKTDDQGEFKFYASSTGLWIVGVQEEDPDTALFAPAQKEHEVPESPLTSSLTIQFATLDATITARLRDAQGGVVTAGDVPIFVDCFSEEEDELDEAPLFFFDEIAAGQSEVQIGVQGGRDYECRIFSDEIAASPAQVTVGASADINADLVVVDASFVLTVEFVDGNGDSVVVAGEVFASTFPDPAFPDPDSEESGVEHSTFDNMPVNGQYTLNLIPGQEYDVGFFAEDDFEDIGDEEIFGKGAFRAFAEDTNYLSRETFREVDTSEGTEATVRFLVEEADATVKVTVLDADGEGVPETWVDLVCEGFSTGGDDEEEGPGGDGPGDGPGAGPGAGATISTIKAAEGDGEPFDDTLEDNALFFGALTDQDGKATLLTLSGLNCVLNASLSPDSNSLNPAPKELVPESGVTEVSLTLQEADFTLGVTLSTTETLDWSYCAAYGEIAQNFADATGGTASIPLIKGGSYEVICEGGAGVKFLSGRAAFTASAEASEGSIEISLEEGGTFYAPQTYEFQAASGTSIELPDGCSRIEVPAGAFGTTGSITLTAGSNREPVPWSETVEPFQLYEISAINGNGQPVKKLSKAINITFCYDDEDVPEGIEESELGCAGSNEQGTTLTTIRSSVDTTANKMTCVTDHLSTYGLNRSGGAVQGSSLSSPTFALWNGFLAQTNILELVNKGGSAANVTVRMFDITGAEQSASVFAVPANGQTDIIVNSLTGFSADSYGLIRLEYTGSNIDGRLFFYRSLDGFQSYEYAYGVPFSNSLQGSSYVAFNTFNPSTSAADAADQVFNWLSIVNLESTEKSFTIRRYLLDGSLLKTESVAVAALGRMDVEAGHGEGANKVGYSEIVPTDTNGRYKALIVRYGARTDGSYAFAFPLIAKEAKSDTWVGISSGGGAQNWLEVQNITNGTVPVTLTFYDNSGAEISSNVLSLGAFAGQHIEASSFLTPGQTGAVRVTSTTANAIVAQSMFYFRDGTGSVAGMYGKQADDSLGGTRWGSWNLYINLFNWLRVFNTSDSTVQATIKIYNGTTLASERVVSLGAKTGMDFGLHETGTYGTAVDNYGLISVEGTGLLTELLRFRQDGAAIDFTAPTDVRP